MYGTARARSAQQAPAPSNNLNRNQQPTRVGSRSGKEAQSWLPWVLLGAFVVWLLWAIVERHERLRDAVSPRNIGLNFRNAAVILFTVLVGLPLIKVAAVKYSAFTNGRLGGRVLVQWTGAA